MLRLVGWITTTAVLAFLMWQTAADNPIWAPAVSAVLLLIISILAGIRIGTDSAAAYTGDLQRVNKVLADQNQELQAANAMLLRQLNSEAQKPPESA